ncbi:hypothetical protein N7326_01810 [Corynebacterium sp. ES2794-CONJ1]|uniref:hypothetical protein n=1 Tax=unclassified Corynebacterium TaxID=2624378 RepID=UPI002167C2AF|nr:MULTISPECIES: hypothetical protein [unclassified Corynebacterium]MCS4489066.1 hypothetical protein [Corynebacterium sp. ES2775-CONJ]MCS4490879.1 hypothetical protein [Corynebacterium sp. ES2715-CONJ3]MCS4531238.1 hypothetical protein [Corynebacterium sp. ES2730-CONJ]MCU9518607.1 hypothetical protein [Corynebacterium sp. ES2794-CONJ1]
MSTVSKRILAIALSACMFSTAHVNATEMGTSDTIDQPGASASSLSQPSDSRRVGTLVLGTGAILIAISAFIAAASHLWSSVTAHPSPEYPQVQGPKGKAIAKS